MVRSAELTPELSPALSPVLSPVLDFLACATPRAWFAEAKLQQDCLLIDHANCEKKAAASAMNLMYRYTAYPDMLTKMSQLAREELLHFQQVVEIMAARGIHYRRLGPSRYAAALRRHIRKEEKAALVDTLIIGAFIEARSCERFAGLIGNLDEELDRFYRSLLKSEARHFQDYLALAQDCCKTDITDRVAEFSDIEAELITTPDPQFRFHSGLPQAG